MSVVSDLFGSTNNSRVTAPTNGFQAAPTALDLSSYADAIRRAQQAALAGPQAANNTANQQTALAQALTAQAAGQGPNPALAQLQQTTDANAKQAAGLIASTRGLNPAEAARLAANAGATANQTAAGQAATMTANQQLAAQQLLAQALSAQRSQDLGQQQADTSLLGTAGGLQNQQNQTNVQNNLGAEQLNQATQSQNANLNLKAQEDNAGIAGNNAQTNGQIAGGLIGGGASVLGAMLYKGGPVPDHVALAHALMARRYADGGIVIPGLGIPCFDGGGAGVGIGAGISALGGPVGTQLAKAMAPAGNPNAFVGSPDPANLPVGSPFAAPWAGAAALLPAMAAGGPVDYRAGGNVPGRAAVKGDSPNNDTVPAMLSPGEDVLPRSVTQAPDAPEKAKEFVEAIRKKKAAEMPAGGYARVLASHRDIQARLKRIEQHLADGGEVDSGHGSMVSAIKSFFSSSGGDKDKARGDVLDKAHAALPESLSARTPMMDHFAKLRAAEAAAAAQ